jgi:hypothetical protein
MERQFIKTMRQVVNPSHTLDCTHTSTWARGCTLILDQSTVRMILLRFFLSKWDWGICPLVKLQTERGQSVIARFKLLVVVEMSES